MSGDNKGGLYMLDRELGARAAGQQVILKSVLNLKSSSIEEDFFNNFLRLLTLFLYYHKTN